MNEPLSRFISSWQWLHGFSVVINYAPSFHFFVNWAQASAGRIDPKLTNHIFELAGEAPFRRKRNVSASPWGENILYIMEQVEHRVQPERIVLDQKRIDLNENQSKLPLKLIFNTRIGPKNWPKISFKPVQPIQVLEVVSYFEQNLFYTNSSFSKFAFRPIRGFFWTKPVLDSFLGEFYLQVLIFYCLSHVFILIGCQTERAPIQTPHDGRMRGSFGAYPERMKLRC